MKPIELYARTPENECTWLYPTTEFIPEIRDTHDLPDQDPRLITKVHGDPYIDGDRCWELATVWFQPLGCYLHQPFMIFQRAGRSGRDHHARFVTDGAVYAQAVVYLNSLLPDRGVEDLVDPNVDIPDLADFYSHTLEGAVEQHRVEQIEHEKRWGSK